MKKTEEQVTIVEAGKELKVGEVLKIDAGAEGALAALAALAALDRAELEAMQAYAHYAMDLSDEEGYDLGLLDEMGYANYDLSDLSPT